MIINLNNICRVTLTDFGARHYNYWHYPFGKKAPPELKEGEILTAELWQVMQIFGETMFNGIDKVPFRDNKIEIL